MADFTTQTLETRLDELCDEALASVQIDYTDIISALELKLIEFKGAQKPDVEGYRGADAADDADEI